MQGRRTFAIAIVAAGVVAATTGTASAGGVPGDSVITVTQPANGAFTVSSTTHRPGPVRFHFVSHKGVDSQGNGGMDITMVRPINGATIADVERHIAAQQGPDAAASTRWLARHAVLFGGSGIEGVGSTETENELPSGTVYLLDVNSVFSSKDPTTASKKVLNFTGPAFRSLAPRISSSITMTSSDDFRVTSTHLGNGNYLVRNNSDTLHFATFQPVKPGTTDADMTRAARQESNNSAPSPNPYLENKPGVNSDVLSPGRAEVFDSALLTPGTYDLECFIADDQSGMPHFFMGMHKIVVIP